jgi:membrane protein
MRLVLRDFVDDRGIDRSAALAYVTLLSLVPLLATVAALYRAFFSFDVNRLIELVTVVLPYEPGTEQHAALMANLGEFVTRASTLGYIGSLVFIAIAFRLFQSVETTFNDIWRVASGRPASIRVFSFTMLVFWGPVVVGLGSSLLLWMGHQPWAPSQGLVLSLARWALPMLGLTMVYWLAPHTGVRIGAAIAGGLVATLGLHILRSVFLWYIDLFPEINIIYGSATLMVLFLVSLFAFWMLVIVGVEVSYVVQNFRSLKLEHEGRRGLGADPAMSCVAVLAECYRRALSGELEPSLDQLEEALSINHPSAVAATERLVTAGLLALTGPRREGFVPARESATVTVAQALRACGAACDDLPPADNEAVEKLARVLRDGEKARAEKLDRVTFADLLQQDSGQ